MPPATKGTGAMADTLRASFGRFEAETVPAEARLTISRDGATVIRLFGRDLVRSTLLGGSWCPDMQRALRWGLQRIEARLGEDLRFRAGVMAACDLISHLRLAGDPRRAERLLLGDMDAGWSQGETPLSQDCGALVNGKTVCGGSYSAPDAMPKPVAEPAAEAFREAVAELVYSVMKEGKTDV
ncbi:hypothetical protein BV509_10240 [Rhodovulum sulfidophilum]|uniref:NIF system FeS cluster assembly NifU N-terminal domain-containing protein n=2 Tax=Rhodovulum visakhapatnamense TaxID=364297 RepID=A0ABS1RJK3_9RHOB|nr:hypothetical protein [Rhodovulum visakhapatnamense]MBL3571642.1 hypothetical protein [Rhodovulum visakhapatnamense]MBL3579818.1 hypothetical protein [Rhodovulum visakhapatnamense]OLS44680.1 hypothetical protein BV509_10240 [Rhodovulum sulfidophilum]